jgi:hypothetical protein
VNRYLENVLYRVVAGNLKIQNNQIAYINSDELVFEVVMVGNLWRMNKLLCFLKYISLFFFGKDREFFEKR